MITPRQHCRADTSDAGQVHVFSSFQDAVESGVEALERRCVHQLLQTDTHLHQPSLRLLLSLGRPQTCTAHQQHMCALWTLGLRDTSPTSTGYTWLSRYNQPFLISDIRAFWHSGLSTRVHKCQQLKMSVRPGWFVPETTSNVLSGMLNLYTTTRPGWH